LEADLRLVDLGIYRLRDLPGPERLFQVTYPDMAQRRFPPLRAEARFAGNPPPSFSRFFGREAPLAALAALLIAECGVRNAELPDKESLCDEAVEGRGTAPVPLIPHSALRIPSAWLPSPDRGGPGRRGWRWRRRGGSRTGSPAPSG